MIYTDTNSILLYIRQQMLAKKIKVSDLAEKMNKAPSTVSQTFKQDNITLENLNDICKALDYDLEINLIEKSKNNTD